MKVDILKLIGYMLAVSVIGFGFWYVISIYIVSFKLIDYLLELISIVM